MGRRAIFDGLSDRILHLDTDTGYKALGVATLQYSADLAIERDSSGLPSELLSKELTNCHGAEDVSVLRSLKTSSCGLRQPDGGVLSALRYAMHCLQACRLHQ